MDGDTGDVDGVDGDDGDIDGVAPRGQGQFGLPFRDRKSTRLNSSHRL